MPYASCGFLFDLDGTLLNTLDDIADCMNTVLQRHGLPAHPTDAYRYFVGEGMENLVRRTAGDGAFSEEEIARLIGEMRTLYGQNWMVKTRPYPGIAETLQALAARDIPLGILSNKPHDFTQAMMRHYFPEAAFTVVLGARPGIPKKPDPQAALEAANLMRLAPEQIWFIGDSKFDMITAVQAGMIPVGVLWGFREAEELRTHGAKHLVREPEELLSLTV